MLKSSEAGGIRVLFWFKMYGFVWVCLGCWITGRVLEAFDVGYQVRFLGVGFIVLFCF